MARYALNGRRLPRMQTEEIAEENELAAALTHTVRADCEEADKS
jgi:hypothetical protein